MIQVFKLREDQTIDFLDSIVVDDSEIPVGYILPDSTKNYKDNGIEMTQTEIDALKNVPITPSLEDQIKTLQSQLAVTQDALDTIIMGGV